MGYYDLSVEEQEKEDAEMLQMRIATFIDKKCDKGIDKGLITKEESQELLKALNKQMKKHKEVDWWLDQKGKKSYEIAYDLLDETEGFEYDDQKEILQKIEKA